jgi:hypothetical protein
VLKVFLAWMVHYFGRESKKRQKLPNSHLKWLYNRMKVLHINKLGESIRKDANIKKVLNDR